MDISENSVLEIWELFSEQLPLSKRQDMAIRFVRILLEQDIDVDDLDEIRGEDEYIDHALDHLGDQEDDDYPDDRYEE